MSIIESKSFSIVPGYGGRKSWNPLGLQPALYAIGVPHPLEFFGYDPLTIQPPSDPTEWPEATNPLFYYVNNETGDDANGNGSPDLPRLTVPENIALPPGTVIVIAYTATPYTAGGDARFQMTMLGTRQNKCFIVGRGASKPLIDLEMRMIGCSHTIVDGLEWTKIGSAHFQIHNSAYSEYMTIRNTTHTNGDGTPLNGSILSGSGLINTNKSKGFVIYNCEIANYGENLSTSVQNDIHAFKPDNNLTDIWYLNNTVTNLGGDCIQVGSGSTAIADRCERVYVAKNDFSDTFENAVDIKSSQDVIISQNDMYNFNRVNTNADDTTVALIVHSGATRVWVLANNVHDSAAGLQSTDNCSEIYFIGNQIWGIDPVMGFDPSSGFGWGFCMHMRQTDDSVMALNTCYDYARGVIEASGTDRNVSIAANLLSTRNSVDGNEILFASSGAVGVTDYNLFYPGAFTPTFRRGATEETLTEYQASTGNETNAVITDPLLNIPASQDFSLQTGSPAIGIGLKVPALDIFESLYGINIYVDYLNVNRPTVPSIGAYEETV